MRTQYEDERDEDIVPLTEEGLHEAAGEVRARVRGRLRVSKSVLLPCDSVLLVMDKKFLKKKVYIESLSLSPLRSECC